MPRQVAPPPSGEFQVVLTKPFNANNAKGDPEHMIEVIGELNRPASVRSSQYTGNSKSSEKTGDMPKYVLFH
ncbi:uncharacterized protein LTR77_009644 [Saxophila tyrrhenica]|uniref:Uncharacterized protein n=1 Tax=Saxophila tyrrhenica TaxID=1690608 RepID=A0AAV9P0Z5_9PEZI|nr:hypothetical protein LTR77_009644 [Saxophila tyrrhenica]